MKILLLLICCLTGYLLGSLSFSIVYSKLALGNDVRKSGSGNAGATNMARVFGFRYGILTLLCDMLKCSVAMILGYHLAGEMGFAVSCASTMIGHCFPLFYKFKGGKGIAVGAAIAFGLDWRIFVFGWIIFLLVLVVSKRVSIGSIVIAVWICIGAFLFCEPFEYHILAVFMMIFVIWRHKDNIKRIIAGTEPEFHIKK